MTSRNQSRDFLDGLSASEKDTRANQKDGKLSKRLLREVPEARDSPLLLVSG